MLKPETHGNPCCPSCLVLRGAVAMGSAEAEVPAYLDIFLMLYHSHAYALLFRFEFFKA